MERRARQLLEQVRAWLPADGPVLDLGSGTGHLSARLEQELGLEVVTADVSDIHVVGPPPVLVTDGVLPFEAGAHTAALLVFMLAYPRHPARVLAEAARVTRGPIIVVQSLHSNRFGRAWLRVREFIWTIAAFHRVEARRLRPTACGVHHEYTPLLYRPGTSTGRDGRRTARSVAAGAPLVARSLAGDRRVVSQARCLSVASPS